ncbi:mechanosensitive ion channel [Danxiaibacter flavus]|uniref:Mechanosensitive ion channel n=1 Tax=Danxiaibacter flavus TaxID=3049108 RepID=A0ABV3ZL80_9BACT|nr:mechanosensitive ion channel [Chitinophagaceae bacterium DXS]
MDIAENKKSTDELTYIKSKHKMWIGSYIFIAIAFGIFYWLLHLHVFAIEWLQRPVVIKCCLATVIVFVILTISKYVEALFTKYGHAKAVTYNFVRLVRIIAVIAIGMVIIGFLFENWYTAAVSLGLISLVLGFALQTPISSFIGWLYIVIRLPYKVGDRIQLGTFKGDVVEISYLDTTLWEFGGDYLTNDLPTGRLIRFPNTLVLQGEVYNYSWRKFPYIWNEIPFHVAYESNLSYVEAVLRKVAKDALGKDMEEKVNELKLLVKQTAVDELDIKEYPFVTFRTNPNTWIEASVNYLVNPKKASEVRNKIIKNATTELLKEPEKVMFPNSNAR